MARTVGIEELGFYAGNPVLSVEYGDLDLLMAYHCLSFCRHPLFSSSKHFPHIGSTKGRYWIPEAFITKPG